MSERTYTLTADLSVRTLGIAGLIDVGGAVVLVLGVALSLVWCAVLGAVLMACGVGLIIAMLLLRRRVTTTVQVTDDDIRITSGGRSASARWSEINDVSTRQQTIVLDRSENRPPLKIDSPRGSADPQLDALARELVTRLDRNRGYRPL